MCIRTLSQNASYPPLHFIPNLREIPAERTDKEGVAATIPNIFRSACPTHCAADSRDGALRALGIRTLIDLRTPLEFRVEPIPPTLFDSVVRVKVRFDNIRR